MMNLTGVGVHGKRLWVGGRGREAGRAAGYPGSAGGGPGASGRAGEAAVSDKLILHLEADGARGFGQAVEQIWQVSKRVPCNPFDTGCLPLSYSEIPGVKWRI